MGRKPKQKETKKATKFGVMERVRTLYPKGPIKAGTLGQVISVLTEPQELYVVEFIKDNGEPIARPTYMPIELRWVD